MHRVKEKSTKSTVNGAESTDVRTVNEVILDTSQRLCRGPLAQDASVRDESRIYYLKDMLGSVVALTDSNGLVVERYEYDPYGRTEVLTVTYMHDANLDGRIDASDEAHLNACLATEEMQRHPMCVFVHDTNGDGIVDLDDLSVFQGFDYTSNGPRPPAEWERAPTSLYDANNDKNVGMFDFYGFQVCFGSTNGLCHYVFDANNDSQVTLADYTTFLASYQRTAPTRTATNGASRFGNPFMWTGQRYDAAVGLYHFLFRSYSPELGRWLQRDPLGYWDGMNHYLMVGSSPATFRDPFGLAPGDGESMKPRTPTAWEMRVINFALTLVKKALPSLPQSAVFVIGNPDGNHDAQTDPALFGPNRIMLDYTLFTALNDPANVTGSTWDALILGVGLQIINIAAAIAHELFHANLDPDFGVKGLFSPHNDESFQIEALFLIRLSFMVNNLRILKMINQEFNNLVNKLPKWWNRIPNPAIIPKKTPTTTPATVPPDDNDTFNPHHACP